MDFFFCHLLFFLYPFFSSVLGKECTNTPTELSSHTLRYGLLSSARNGSLISYHLPIKESSSWRGSLPRKVLKEELDWGILDSKSKNSEIGLDNENFLQEVSLHDVRLDPDTIHGRAQQTNLEYLLMLDVDSLVWSFRKTAGLSTPGTPYGGWEEPSCELRGHFVAFEWRVLSSATVWGPP